MTPVGGAQLVEYTNIERPIAAVVSRRLATLHELQTVYSAEDLYKLLEIAAVDAYNERALAKDSH